MFFMSSENHKASKVDTDTMELDEDAIIKEMEKHRKNISGFGVKEIGLFGSYLGGKQREDSDIDILVEFEEGEKNFDNYMGLKFFLEDLFERDVDLVIKNAVKPHMKEYILGSTKYVAGV